MKKFILCCLLFGAAHVVFAQKTIINVDLNKERDELKKRIQDALAQVGDLSGRLNQAVGVALSPARRLGQPRQQQPRRQRLGRPPAGGRRRG
mgnify:CR=1 FL=1